MKHWGSLTIVTALMLGSSAAVAQTQEEIEAAREAVGIDMQRIGPQALSPEMVDDLNAQARQTIESGQGLPEELLAPGAVRTPQPTGNLRGVAAAPPAVVGSGAQGEARSSEADGPEARSFTVPARPPAAQAGVSAEAMAARRAQQQREAELRQAREYGVPAGSVPPRQFQSAQAGNSQPAPRSIPSGAEPQQGPGTTRPSGSRVYTPGAENREVRVVEPTPYPPGYDPNDETWIGGRAPASNSPPRRSWLDALLDTQRNGSLITYDRIQIMAGTAEVSGTNVDLEGEFLRFEFARSANEHLFFTAETEIAVVDNQMDQGEDEAALSISRVGAGLAIPLGRPASLYFAGGPLIQFIGGEASNNIAEQENFDFFGGTNITAYGEVGIRTLITSAIDFGLEGFFAPDINGYSAYIDVLFGTGHAIGVEGRIFEDAAIEYTRIGLHYTYYF